MKDQIKKIISILLMAGLLTSVAFFALPPSFGKAAGPITATASPTEKTGVAGETIHFAVTIANTDATNVASLILSASSVNSWSLSLTGNDHQDVGPNSSTTVIVNVTIPTNASLGQTDVITLSVNEGLPDPGTFATSVTMTITVVSPSAGANRPQLVVDSSSYGSKPIKAGSEFELALVLRNNGQISAFNNVVTFSGEGFYPLNNGGVQSIQNIEPGGKITFNQKFKVSDALAWDAVGSITVNAEYSDSAGQKYTNTFTVPINLANPYTGAATSTPAAISRPQLVITSNTTDVDPLQPGTIFELSLEVKNLGTSDARSVTMVLGGGASTVNDQGTPQPGVSGSGADLTNFAPLGGSNVVVVGDIAQGETITIKQRLIVNVSTVPGVYTLKISFAYLDNNIARMADDQVITLRVYSLPQVEINFYRDPGTLTAGMSNTLPLQVTNLGKKTFVLGNMKVSSAAGDVANNVALVGALDPGGYFTLDTEIMPYAEGPFEIEVIINYTDDFNQPREITQVLSLAAMPAPVFTPDPGMTEGMPVETNSGGFWSKVVRFFKGLFGLGSGESSSSQPIKETLSPDEDYAPVIVAPKG